MSLFGGLALFLFGMDQMATALKAVAGERMKGLLARLTSNRLLGAITGALVTAVIQSSSVTTVLVVGFVSAGLMSLMQSIGVIMGANIGTTITAQIVAFKVTKAALLMIGIGFSLLFFSKHERIKQYGTILMGLGLVFFGMSIMSDAMRPLRDYQPFLLLMAEMDNPLIAILAAAAFTALIQSSSATTGIVIVMASQGFVSLPAGIALAFGANIGTCVTALLAAIGKPREAIRAAFAHVLFNVAGVLVWLAFIPYLADLVTLLSPSYPHLDGTARVAAETPRQIANAHTIFNLANTLLFIGLTSQFARLVNWLVPDRPPTPDEAHQTRPRYLDQALVSTPSLALDRVRMEIQHMGSKVEQMLDRMIPALLSGDRHAINRAVNLDDQVDVLYAAIIRYLGTIGRQPLTEAQTTELMQLLDAVNELENIGDVIETNLAVSARELSTHHIAISVPTQEVLTGFHGVVRRALSTAIQAVSQNNPRAANAVISMKQDINRLAGSAALHQTQRLVAAQPDRLPAYTIEMDIVEKLKRIYYFAKRIAKTVDQQSTPSNGSVPAPKHS